MHGSAHAVGASYSGLYEEGEVRRAYQRPTLAQPNGNQDRVLAYNRRELPRWDKYKQYSL